MDKKVSAINQGEQKIVLIFLVVVIEAPKLEQR